ncbi:baseplate J/gp47 family protein [Paenibacillus sp. 1P03SA]|uniref:baseplate J/gp47 family protein n=1 Tax=Paenibacillus sp. 1P03SA TaxID=3132294 RepID=UPI0039A17A9E
MYEDQTKDVILARMLNEVPSDMDKRPGSITYDMQSPASIEFALAYIELSGVLDKGFAATTYGEYLTLRCAEMAVYRKGAVKASVPVTLTGADGTVIKAGQRVSTDTLDPVYFVTRKDVTIINGSATVDADAEVGGKNGNVGVGQIRLTVGNITGVASVTNHVAADGGADEESDEELLVRYEERVSTPSTSGNAAHYRQWAKEVPGISDAIVYPTWNGNGTVKVVLLDTDKTTPTPAKVAEVAAYIEDNRPIGATVTVVGAVEVPINVSLSATIASTSSIAAVKKQLEEGLKTYLNSLAFRDPLVRYTQVQRVILDIPDIIDYTGLKVNGQTFNLEIPNGSVAVIGTVTLV